MFKNYLNLIRMGQWYKNILIFLPLIFAPQTAHSWPLLILGFLGFSCVSSMTYIINDWVDREEDKRHPLKKERPLASGAISGKTAFLVSILLMITVSGVTFKLGLFFGAIVATYFILTNAYSFKLKHIPLLDIFLIAFNFILRTLAGLTELPNAEVAPYFAAVFALIIMMITFKRRGDNQIMGKKAASHKPVLKFYTPTKTSILIGGAWALWITTIYLTKEFNQFGAATIVLITTNYFFVHKPSLAVKPKLLLKEWPWVLILITAIAYLVIS
jgi:4-hydroxybenzoate polyprenyltransferase